MPGIHSNMMVVSTCRKESCTHRAPIQCYIKTNLLMIKLYRSFEVCNSEVYMSYSCSTRKCFCIISSPILHIVHFSRQRIQIQWKCVHHNTSDRKSVV